MIGEVGAAGLSEKVVDGDVEVDMMSSLSRSLQLLITRSRLWRALSRVASVAVLSGGTSFPPDSARKNFYSFVSPTDYLRRAKVGISEAKMPCILREPFFPGFEGFKRGSWVYRCVSLFFAFLAFSAFGKGSRFSPYLIN